MAGWGVPNIDNTFSQLSKAAKDISSHLGSGIQNVAENLEDAFIQFGSDTAHRAGCVSRTSSTSSEEEGEIIEEGDSDDDFVHLQEGSERERIFQDQGRGPPESMGCGSSVAPQHTQNDKSQEAMICDMCQSRLNFINRKKICDECGNCFCKNCLPRESGNSRTCSRCKVLVRRPGERTELMKLRVKDLQNYLCRRKINIKSCVEKKDLVELVLQTNGDASGGVPGGGVHGPGQGGGGPATTDHNRPRVPASNSWQDNTIRVSDQIPLERPSNFPQSYVESTHRREFFERFGNNMEEEHLQQLHELGAGGGGAVLLGDLEATALAGKDSNSSPDVISLKDSSDEKPLEEKSGVNPVDRIVPFSHQEDQQQQTDNKDNSDIIEGVEVTEVTPVEVIEASETLVENIEEDDTIGVDTEENTLTSPSPASEPRSTRSRGGERNQMPRLLSTEDIIEVSVIPDNTSESEILQQISGENEENTTESADESAEIKDDSEKKSSSRGSGATKKLKPDLLAETSTSLPCSPRRFANQGVVYLSEIQSVEDFKDLSAKQVKEILAMNRVNFKGCVEKEELLKIVERLWRQEQRNKEGLDQMQDDSLCKICMDAAIDCVMLECGHMCTCTNCGKQMAECPICRQYVVRVVRIFKS